MTTTGSRTDRQRDDGTAFTVDGLEAAVSAHDLDAVANAFSVDAVLELGPVDSHLVGRAAIREYFRQLFAQAPDIELRTVSRYRDGSSVIDELMVVRTEPAPCSSQTVLGIFEVRSGFIQRSSFYRAMPDAMVSPADGNEA